MKETSYYELKMPDSNDTIDVSVLNNNMKRLDDVLILTVIGRNAETSEFVKKCCAPYIMIQNLGEETVTIYDRRWPEDMWEDNKIVIEPTKFHIYRVANSVNANFLVLDNKECNFRYFITAEQAIAEGGGGGGGGTTDYNELDNQPKINGFTLIGNKSFKELGLLNDDGKIKSDYLPPFVDNMDSYDTEADFPRPGVEDRLYLDKSTNLAYVWAGTDYACIGTPLALGITHETAGYGDESRAAYNHSLSEHARVDATKTEGSSQNGYVKINGEETKVYEHPGTGTNPHGTTKTDVGLGNVLDAKQVTVTEQAYSDTEKAQARKNIGAGTSSFSGKYSDLAEIPSEFTPAEHNHDDLYAHKTSVSSSNETTSVINVTDAKAQMAMVAKISGKTQKAVQLFDPKTSVNVVGTTFTCSNGLVSITGTGTTSGTGRTVSVLNSGIDIVASHKYYLVVPKDSGYSVYWFIQESNGTSIQMFNGSTPAIFSTSKSYTGAFIGYNVSTSTFNSKGYLMLFDLTAMYGAGKEPTLEQCASIPELNFYVPVGAYIYSTPVESVVSVGKNQSPHNDFKVYGTAMTGNYTYDNILPNTTYTISFKKQRISGVSISNNNLWGLERIQYYNGSAYLSETQGSVVTLASGETSLKYTFTTPQTCNKIVIVYSNNNGDTNVNTRVYNVQLEFGNTQTAYTPYNKTTVLVPSAVKNLPDYGCSVGDIANEIDFENGVYCHRVKMVDVGSTTLTSVSGSTTKYSFALNDRKAGFPQGIASGGYSVSNSANKDSISDMSFATLSSTVSGMVVRNDTFTSASDATSKLKGVYLIYELATPETIPLSDYLRPLPVENGGTLTLVNEHNLDVNSRIKYKKEV